MDVRLPDGTVIQGVPDGTTKAQLAEKLKRNGYEVPDEWMGEPDKAAMRDAMIRKEILTSPPVALARGLKDIIDTGAGFLARLGGKDEQARVRAADAAGRAEFDKAAEGTFLPHVARLGGNIAATVPALGALGAAVAKAAPRLGAAIQSGGMTTGAVPVGAAAKAGDLAIRSAGGGIGGFTAAGMVDPESAKTGGVIGAALPVASKVAGLAGQGTGAAARAMFGKVEPEVAALAKRAKELGIDIPADRLVSSKPLDAVASALNYVPFSGRAASEAKMATQLNQAASKLMGQNTPNINKAIRDASVKLGGEFDSVLKTHGVKFDQVLLDDIAGAFNTAEKELGSDALRPIASQVDELMAKGSTGVIDGQAAYNIKRTLDRIGRQNTPTAYHALELKRVLMDGLNRSLGPEKAAAFATTRQQYGNMLAFEKLARNGVEGEISVARLANLKNINNEPLQELADIAAQFVKAREGQHGAMQRAVVGLGTAATAGPVGLAAGATTGRAANMLLNSQTARNALMGQSAGQPNLLMNELQRYLAQTAPVLAADR